MGRKIPGAKHHGVKDPLKQQAERMKRLKSKINAPPSHSDDQPIPKSLTRLFEFKERQEQRLKAKKNKKNAPVIQQNEKERYPNPMKSMSRLPGESARGFTLRINSALHSITRRHLQTREHERSQNPDDYLPEEDAKEERFDYIQQKKLKRKMKEEKKAKASGEEVPAKLSRMQHWTLKKKERKAKEVEEKEESFEPRYERVQFGEVAHKPPSLHVKPRQARAQAGAARPGQRDLLLNRLLNPGEMQAAAAGAGPAALITARSRGGGVNRTARRRTLPVGVRLRLEQSQQEAVQAYRAIKALHDRNKK